MNTVTLSRFECSFFIWLVVNGFGHDNNNNGDCDSGRYVCYGSRGCAAWQRGKCATNTSLSTSWYVIPSATSRLFGRILSPQGINVAWELTESSALVFAIRRENSQDEIRYYTWKCTRRNAEVAGKTTPVLNNRYVLSEITTLSTWGLQVYIPRSIIPTVLNPTVPITACRITWWKPLRNVCV